MIASAHQGPQKSQTSHIIPYTTYHSEVNHINVSHGTLTLQNTDALRIQIRCM
jgi:hypothetical protein